MKLFIDTANTDEIREFLLEECKEAYGLILSVDMLLYGGLIPSRMHHETEEVLKERLSTIKKIKEMNPQIKIYACFVGEDIILPQRMIFCVA